MPLMVWDTKYSVGVDAMDAQHQKWFGILNRLHDAMMAGKGREVQEAVMAEMVAYTRTHFLQEELLLKSKGFPNLPQHREKHVAFTKEVQELEAKLLGGAAVLTVDVMNSMKNWLRSHILAEDTKYGAYLKAL